jgi:serine/threonine protein phosphatase 1
MGNHEEMMLDFLAGPPGTTWLFNGGWATLISYGVGTDTRRLGLAELELLRRRLDDALPASHRRFLAGLRLSHVAGGYVFVHAGIRPGVAVEAQSPRDLLWIRGPFLTATEDFGVCVVHGHTIVAEPDVATNRIGIDTGAFFSGRLTCLVLEGGERRFLHT